MVLQNGVGSGAKLLKCGAWEYAQKTSNESSVRLWRVVDIHVYFTDGYSEELATSPSHIDLRVTKRNVEKYSRIP